MVSDFRRTIVFLSLLVGLSTLSSCEDTNLFLLADAGIDAVNAVTLSDEDVQNIAAQAARESDRKHNVAPPGSPYEIRLNRLVHEATRRDEMSFDVKVYLTRDVNAFAMADGTIRIYSGLMDLMNDEELLFVIGHEMGHVVLQHSRKKVVLAYASSALRKGLASQENQIGEIARSTIGAFAQNLANAQFSQHEERQADDYGAAFLVERGHGREAAVSALRKLEKLARQHTFLSSHPDPAKRAERLMGGADDTTMESDESIIKRLWNVVVALFHKVAALIRSFVG